MAASTLVFAEHLGTIEAVAQSRHTCEDLLGTLTKWLDLVGRHTAALCMLKQLR